MKKPKRISPDVAVAHLPVADRPYIENYPPLRDWLVRHQARCLSQDAVGEDFWERWRIGVRVVLVEVRAKKGGWDLWTACDSVKVEETFKDAERRLGIA